MEDVKTGKRSWGLSLEVFVRLLTLVLVLEGVEGVMMLEFAMMFVVILGFESLFFFLLLMLLECVSDEGVQVV